MGHSESETRELLGRAAAGDRSAVNRLIAAHRERLRRMLQVRMDRRLAARVDPSDVVQEVLLDAAAKLPQYLDQRPLPFYPWLRQLAWNRLVDLHRQHVLAGKRSVSREDAGCMELSDASAQQLADRFAATTTGPVKHLLRRELRARVRAALDQMPFSDREILVMRHLEELSTGEIASVLNVPLGTVKSRHFRALERLQTFLRETFEETP